MMGNREEEYWKKKAQKLQEEKDFNETMMGIIPIIVFLGAIIAIAIWG